MFSFLRSWVFHFSQPPPLEDDQPPPLKDDPTGDPSRTVYPLHTVPDPYHYEYHGPFDVAPTDMPNFIDILLSDVKKEDLHHDISTALGSGYLSETPHLRSPHATVDGIMFGRNNRVMFPLVVRVGNSRSYVLHFLYDSGCPFTFLSREVCDKLFRTNPVPAQFNAWINGEHTTLHPPNAESHFEHVNLLGADVCFSLETTVNINYKKRNATMHFPSLQQV